MKPHDEFDSLSIRLLETATEQVRDAVADGCEAAVENALEAFPSLAEDADQVLDLMYAEIVAREERSEQPTAAEYAARFRSYADRIERLFEVHEAFRDQTPDDGGAPSTVRGEFGASVPAFEGRDAAASPQRVGQYELLDELGSGATGIVFRAEQKGLGRTVAVKILRPFGSVEARKRFRAEAEMTAQLRHPNIVQVYEVGQDSGCDFMSMELLCDGSLATVLGQTTFTPQGAAELVSELAGGVAAAHDQGIVHRDLKPGNVLMAPDGSPRIGDFGLARHLSDMTTRQTRTGAILGTPGYMAPEQVDGSAEAGAAADIYSLGAILYELLTGRPPYHGTSVAEILAQMQGVDPPPVRQLRPGVPRDLRTICMKCLQRSPADRYVSAADLQSDLQNYLRGLPVSARPVTPLEHAGRWVARHKPVATLAALAVLMTAVGGAGIVWQWLRAEDGLAQARISAAEARSAEQAEQRQRFIAENRLYRQQILGADRELRFGALTSAIRILGNCDPSQRRWEWARLNAAAQSANRVISRPDLKFHRIALSNDGRLLAATSGLNSDLDSRRIIVWDAQSGEQIWESNEAGSGMSLAFSRDGQSLAVGGYGKAIVHDALTGEVRKTLIDSPRGGWGVTFSPDGRTVAVGEGRAARLFAVDPDDSSTVVCKGLQESGGAHDVHYHPDGTLLAVATRNLGVTIHDPVSGDLMESLEMPGDVRVVEFSPDGSLLIAAGYSGINQGCLRVWEKTESGFEVVNTRFDRAGKYSWCRFSRDGQNIATWTETSLIRLVNPRDFREAGIYTGHRPATTDAAFGPDSRVFATCGADGSIRIWDRTPESRMHLRRDDWAHATDFAVDPYGRFAALVGDANPSRGFRSFSNSVEIMDLQRWTRIRSLVGHTRAVSCVDWDHRGRCLVSGSDDTDVRIWLGETGECLQTLTAHEAAIAGVHFAHVPDSAASDDSQSSGHTPDPLITVDRSGEVLIHNFGSPSQPLRRMDAQLAEITHTALRGSQLGLSSNRGRAIVLDLNSGTRRELIAVDSPLHSIAISPTGEQACVSAEDGRVFLWQLQPDQQDSLWTVTLPGPVKSVAFHPDGDRIVACGSEGAATILDASNGSSLLSLWPTGQSSAVSRALFDQQGRRLMATSRQRLYAWDREPVAVAAVRSIPEDDAVCEAVAAWHRKQARACEATENPFGAAAHWARYGQLMENDGPCHVRAAENYAKAGRYTDAEQHYRRALEVANANADNSNWTEFRGRAQHELARFLATCPDESFRNGAEALRLIRQALLISPRYAPYWATLTEAMQEARRTPGE